MEIELDTTKTIEENAGKYFQESKRFKQKLSGLERAEAEMHKKIQKTKTCGEKKKLSRKRERQWFEKFHWFKTSTGKLCLAGRDKHSNEQLIKKHLEKDDLFFHADVLGAAHCILKNGAKASTGEKKEAAGFAAVWTKAWNEKIQSIDVYSAKPEQISKKAPSGESIGTGAFMVYGKREWFKKIKPALALWVEEKTPVCAPPATARALGKKFVQITQGEQSKSEVGKKVKKVLEKKGTELCTDEIMQLLPGNSLKLSKKA